MEIRFTPTQPKLSQGRYPYPTVSITVDDDDLDMDQMLEVLVKPALVGLGYTPGLIEEYFRDEDDA